jgi:hypothetical protein
MTPDPIDIIVIIENDTQRIDDAQVAPKLNRLQFFRVSGLHCNGAQHGDAPSKGE